MPPGFSDRELRLFQDLIYDLAGIHMNDNKKALISGRLWKRLRHHGLNSYAEYYKLITAPNSPERQIVVDLLTTNETFFFRENAHFEFLRDRILPDLDRSRTLRIWSAACSSGEEPYSIAMVLAHLRVTNREILASDISEKILDRAARGVYRLDATKNIPRQYLRDYCLKGRDENEGFFRVGEEVRRHVLFRQINLNRPFPEIGKFQLVWLRNAMIYFNSETRRQIVERMAGILEPGGYFFIGHSETLHGITDKLKMVKPAVYRKK